MKKLFKKSRILQQFLSDNVLLDASALVPDYFFSDRCLMAPFYLVIQIVRALYDSDLFYAATLLEEFETYHEPFLSGRLVKALLHMEKDEMKDAERLLEEMEPSFSKRPAPYRFYLRAQDSVYRADHMLFKKLYPLARIRYLVYTGDMPEKLGGELAFFREAAAAEGTERIWIDRYELSARMAYYRRTKNLTAQENEIGMLLEGYEEQISRLNMASSQQTRNVRKQTSFIVQQMFQVIEQYETSLQHKKTLFWCDQILLLQPQSQKTLVTKIEVLKKLKSYHCALGFCNAFIRNDPRDSVGYYLRSNTYFLMNDDKKALQDAQDCYRRSGDKKLGLLARGFSLLNLEQYEKAAGCFEIVCSMGNPSYEALRGLGKAYAFMDKTIKALECYIQCRRMDPLDLDLLYDIADTQFMGGYFEEAKKSCLACLRQNANFAGSYMILGMIALREEKETLALHYFDKTLQLDSKNPYALNEKGFLCHLSGDDSRAKELIEQALQEFPDYADALCNKGIVCCMTDELEEALQDFDKALLIIPGHLGASLGKANVFLQEGKAEEALELYEEVLKIYPFNEEATRLRETAQKMLGIPIDDVDDDRTDYE